MKTIEFGGCFFLHSEADTRLYLQSRDLQGTNRDHAFDLQDAFLVNPGGKLWRLITGVSPDCAARYVFEDAGDGVEIRVRILQETGIPVLDKAEGKQNLERHKLPLKRLMLTC